MSSRRGSRKVNRAWLHDHVTDPYVRRAQVDGYRSRAAYKLQEIDEALGLVRPGQTVVDLGSAPGAWSQYLRRRMGAPGTAGGRIVALDLLPMVPVDGVDFLLGDFREPAVLALLEAQLGGAAVDLVRKACWSARPSTAAATASSCGCSRTASGSSGRSSRRHRATGRPKPSSSGSV